MRFANVPLTTFKTNTLDNDAIEAAANFNRRLLELVRRLLRDPDRRLTPATRHIGQLLLDMVLLQM